MTDPADTDDEGKFFTDEVPAAFALASIFDITASAFAPFVVDVLNEEGFSEEDTRSLTLITCGPPADAGDEEGDDDAAGLNEAGKEVEGPDVDEGFAVAEIPATDAPAAEP